MITIKENELEFTSEGMMIAGWVAFGVVFLFVSSFTIIQCERMKVTETCLKHRHQKASCKEYYP